MTFLRRLRAPKALRYMGLGVLTTVAILAATLVTSLAVDLGPVVRSRAEAFLSDELQRPVRIGALSIRLTDATGDFKKAVVTIDRVTLQPGNDSTAQAIVLRDTPITTDLLTLANDVATLVDGAVVPAGTYGQLRFVISGAYIEVEIGRAHV